MDTNQRKIIKEPPILTTTQGIKEDVIRGLKDELAALMKSNRDYLLENIAMKKEILLEKQELLVTVKQIKKMLIEEKHNAFIAEEIKISPPKPSYTKNKGLTAKQINEITVYQYKKGYGTICVLCKTKFKEDDFIKILKCGHIFHMNCLDQYLITNDTCPKCGSSFNI